MDNQKIKSLELINKNLTCDEIHWWQFPLNYFSVKFSDNYKDKLFDKIYTERSKSLEFAKYINQKSKKYNKNWSFKRQRALVWHYKSEANFIPAWFVYESALYFNLDLLEIEKNIVAYITFRGKIIVYPIFPVKVTPEFTSVPIHIMGDGCLTPEGLFCYGQKDINNLKRFVSLIKNIFGDYTVIDTKRKYGIPVVYVPKIFSIVITNYFNINLYLSSEWRIAESFKQLGRYHELAVLSAFVNDEGCTSAGVYICSSNLNLLRDVMDIGENLGYKFNSIITSYPNHYNKLRAEHYKVNMSASSIEKFYLDLKLLYNKFPLLNIGRKYENLEKWVNIKNRGWIQRKKLETKKIIINLLRNGEKTAYQLGDGANISVWTTYHHLQQLTKKGQVVKYKSGRQYLYKLV